MIVVRYADDIIVGFECTRPMPDASGRDVCAVAGVFAIAPSGEDRLFGFQPLCGGAAHPARARQTETFNFLGFQGRRRLASFMSWSDRAGADRVVRRYPATVRLEEMEGGELRILPSALCLGALLIADPKGTLADCVFYREARLEPECNARRDDNLYDRHKDLLKAAAEKEEAIERALARV